MKESWPSLKLKKILRQRSSWALLKTGKEDREGSWALFKTGKEDSEGSWVW